MERGDARQVLLGGAQPGLIAPHEDVRAPVHEDDRIDLVPLDQRPVGGTQRLYADAGEGVDGAGVAMQGEPLGQRALGEVRLVDGRPWLADTGYGASGILEPVPLKEGVHVRQGAWTYGIGLENEGIHVLRTLRPEGWADLYAFAPQTLYPGDFTVMNHYSSTHPHSRFIGQIVVQQPGPEVRHTLVRDELTTSRADGTHEQRTVPAGELTDVLEGIFGIELDAEDSAALVRVHSAGR
jgi:arylamine N-acetyltransferase